MLAEAKEEDILRKRRRGGGDEDLARRKRLRFGDCPKQPKGVETGRRRLEGEDFVEWPEREEREHRETFMLLSMKFLR